jgi:tRNA (guanine-N7-)-methyltransferase
MNERKTTKANDLETFSRLLAPYESLKGVWRKEYFENKNPIVLELGCGKGDYTLALAELFPEKNFIGIDKHDNNVWFGAKSAFERELINTAFLNIHIENLGLQFDTNEVDEIWLPFPDPYPESYNFAKRLTSPNFLRIYKEILDPEGSAHLKTNDPDFLDSTLEFLAKANGKVMKEIRDIYNNGTDDPILRIKTADELGFLNQGDRIHYLQFAF